MSNINWSEIFFLGWSIGLLWLGSFIGKWEIKDDYVQRKAFCPEMVWVLKDKENYNAR